MNDLNTNTTAVVPPRKTNGGGNKKTPETVVRTSPYQMKVMRTIPKGLLTGKGGRGVTNYGWENMKVKGYITVPYADADNAKSSAFSYGKAHNMVFRTMPAIDDQGNTPQMELRDENGKVVMTKPRAKGAKPEPRMVPVEYFIVLVEDNRPKA